jgi:hypothetical protein
MPSKIRLPQKSEPVSVSIIIQVGDKAIGAIQTIEVLEEDESGNTLEYPQAMVYRVRFDKEAMVEAFGGQTLVHPTSQRYPFDIEVLGGEKPATLQNCWILGVSYSYLTEKWMIIDEMQIEMEKFIDRSIK